MSFSCNGSYDEELGFFISFVSDKDTSQERLLFSFLWFFLLPVLLLLRILLLLLLWNSDIIQTRHNYCSQCFCVFLPTRVSFVWESVLICFFFYCKNCYILSFFFVVAVVMLHEQTATPVINSRHLASLSRHFPASVLSQEPREESRPPPLSHSLREDRTSQQVRYHKVFNFIVISSDKKKLIFGSFYSFKLTLERRQFDGLVSSREDEKFEQQLLQSAGLWNL